MGELDISEVVKNNLCYSCGACDVSCNANAITFRITNVGRLHPVVDHNICNNCGVCYKVCPAIDVEDKIYEKLNRLGEPFLGNVLSCYIGKSTNEKVYKNSQSGGLVTQTLIYLFQKKLITHALVVKMNYGNPPMPKYYLATSIDDLFPSQKSVYNPVNLLSALKDIESIDGTFAAVGLPCHMEGLEILYKYRKKILDKIRYKLGLICDGLFTFSSIDYFAQRAKTNRDFKIVYRNKNYLNYLGARVTLQTSDRKEHHIDSLERFILKEYLTPPRCNLCFAKMNVFADIVYGDPWGIKGADMNRGESIVICRIEEGERLIKEMIDEKAVALRPIDYSDVVKGQKIDQHKIRTISYFKAYKKKGSKYPKYFEILESKVDKPDNNFYVEDAKRYIERFLTYEKLPREKLLKILNWEIKKRSFVSKVKSLMKSFIYKSMK